MTAPLTVMSVNVLFGAAELERFDRLLALVRSQSPDVLVMQECCAWETTDRLIRVAEAMGAVKAELGIATKRGKRLMNVALLSKLPVQTVTAHNPADVTHVLMDATVTWNGAAVRILGAHFTASEQEYRRREVAWITRELLPQGAREERILLVGDLNSLSRRDPYPRSFVDTPPAGRAQEKFGNPIAFDILDSLEAHGFVDTLRRHGDPEVWVTAPRPYQDIREDFILASPAMAERLARSWVGPYDAAMSDHAPVLARFIESVAAGSAG